MVRKCGTPNCTLPDFHDGPHSFAIICGRRSVNKPPSATNAAASGSPALPAGAATAGGSDGSSAVYIIVVQGTERLLFDEDPLESEPFLRVHARRVATHPGLDAESATAWGLTLQGLAHELLRGLQAPSSALSSASEAAGATATAIAATQRSR